MFVEEKPTCNYVFHWKTPVACYRPGGPNASKGASATQQAGMIVGVIIAMVIVFAIIGFVMHKKGELHRLCGRVNTVQASV